MKDFHAETQQQRQCIDMEPELFRSAIGRDDGIDGLRREVPHRAGPCLSEFVSKTLR